MTTADLTVGAPGRPDAGTELDGHELPLDGSYEPEEAGAGSPITQESVRGLVLTAANLVHLTLSDRFPERPQIAVMTDEEADRIAGALLSMAARNPALQSARWRRPTWPS